MHSVSLCYMLFLATFLCFADQVERQLPTELSNINLSIDTFPNSDANNISYCKKRNGICENKSCTKCVCKNFDTFLSKESGCVNKSNGDSIILENGN